MHVLKSMRSPIENASVQLPVFCARPLWPMSKIIYLIFNMNSSEKLQEEKANLTTFNSKVNTFDELTFTCDTGVSSSKISHFKERLFLEMHYFSH